jgi:alanine dehydrogenase
MRILVVGRLHHSTFIATFRQGLLGDCGPRLCPFCHDSCWLSRRGGGCVYQAAPRVLHFHVPTAWGFLMALLLTEEDVRVLLDMPEAIKAVEESFRRQARGEACLLPRRRLALAGRLNLSEMAAGDSKGDWVAVKIYTVAHGRFRFVVLLYSVETGELAALIEADFLGQMRTGAATGIATKYLARPDARTAAIIGTGLQARSQLGAITRVRNLKRVLAYGRDSLRRANFCREMSRRHKLPVIPATSAEEAIREADIVVTATTSAEPVLLGTWLATGTHVNAIGVNFAQKRELDSQAVNRAALIVVDSIEQSRMESGDLIQAFGEDGSRWQTVRELADIVVGKVRGRSGAEEITLFKSNGIATWDVAVAASVLERAQEKGLGCHIAIGE